MRGTVCLWSHKEAYKKLPSKTQTKDDLKVILKNKLKPHSANYYNLLRVCLDTAYY